MRILIAPDKFKGSMCAGTVGEILARMLELEGFETQEMPIADGGEGTTEVLCEDLEGKMVDAEVQDAMGNSVIAEYALAGDTAVLEMSQASGLWRIPEEKRDPWTASTFGTGEMLWDVIFSYHVSRIVIGIGGSATNDGGAGMARALGYHFLDQNGVELTEFPRDLDRVESITFDKKIEFPKIEVACDVDNPLLGEQGATRIYGPQKGVKEEDFGRFEERLERLAMLAARDLGKPADLKDQPGAGAAGGLGFGLMAFCDAELRPGFEVIADLIGLRAALDECDAVVTGEGNLDRQTLNGKGPHGLAQMARRRGKPVIAVVGDSDNSPEVAAEFDLIVKIRPEGLSVAESIKNGASLLGAPEVSTEIVAFLKSL